MKKSKSLMVARSIVKSSKSESFKKERLSEEWQMRFTLGHKKEENSEKLSKKYKNMNFFEHIARFWERFTWITRESQYRSFLQTTRAFCSQSLFWHERPEQFAHSRSLVLGDLSKSLTVAHLIWAIWANEWMSKYERMSDEPMNNERVSEFPTLFVQSFLDQRLGLIDNKQRKISRNISTPHP